MRQRNKLYTVNKWNQPAFMPKENLFFDGGQSSYSLPPLEGYLPQGLSNDTYRKLAIGSAGQMQNAFHNYSQSIVSNFGKGTLTQNNSPFQNTSMLNTDSNTFFNAVNTAGTLGSAAREKGTSLFSKGAWQSGGAGWAAAGAAAGALGSINTGERRGMWDTLDPVHHIAGGRESKVGNAMGDTGVALTQAGLSSGQPWLALAGAGMKILGGLTNAAFGIKTNEERLKGVNQGIETNRNFVSNADSFDAIKGPTAALTNTNVYKGGWFSGGKARRKNEELKERMIAARDWANRSVGNNIYNLVDDQQNDLLANYAAYGGPLDFGTGALGLMQQNRYFDTIDKRSEVIASKGQTMQTGFTGGAKSFADGGLKTAFMDEFGKDPIGAAVRYNKGLEALAAQEEARQAEAQREAEYADMQKRLLNLETENRGLQAMMAVMPTINTLPEIPTSSFTPSLATKGSSTQRRSSGNSTWDYIEGELRKSGKFNDIQIEGIKYNLQRESSFDPTIVGDGGAAFGLGQWHGSRQPKDKSLKGQTKHLIETLSNFDGKEHWIGRGNYEGFMNARTPEEAHYYIAKGYERPRADIIAKVKRDSDMSLSRLRAFGGELGTNGTDWTNGLLWVSEGGTHEENPLDGVPMGLDPEGVPNLVEEGETVYNDYVFSDRMKVPFFMYKELGLGGVIKKKGKEMSFADASKKLAQESEQRPNDPISKAGLDASLAKLAEIQETERMKKNAEEYMGLEEYACGGKMKKYATGGSKGNLYWGWGEQPNQFVPWWPQTTASSTGLTPSELQELAAKQATEKAVVEKAAKNPAIMRTSNFDYGNGASASAKPVVPANTPATRAMTEEEFREEYPMIARPIGTPQGNKWTDGSVWKGLSDLPAARTTYQGVPEEDTYTYPTWMRYAPVVGSGIMALTDALGLTNKPDYSYAAKLEAAAESAGYAPDVRYNPIGDYMRYTPLDRQYYINQIQANARATDRAIRNTSSPAKNAALLASGYNTTLSLGNLARQAEEYNRAQYERVKEFNRKTNMFNSQMDLEAAMANARYQQAARQMGLSGLAQAAAMRDAIDARVGAAKSANLTNFLTSLGNIGRENFAMNQINWDKSRGYSTDASGRSRYKRTKR